MIKQASAERVSSVEQLLFDAVERLKRNPVGRRAVVIHMSRLNPTNRGAHQVRIAANTFEALVKQYDGQMFLLQQSDVVFICREENVVAIDAAVGKVRFLFADDPVSAQVGDSGSDTFVTWFNPGDGSNGFYSYVDAIRVEDERRRKRMSAIVGKEADERQPMDLVAMNELLTIIGRADLTNLLRRQSICEISPDEAPKPLFREIYVSIADLRDAVMPKRDIASDRWLFQYLTQTLDRRVLALLRKADDSGLSHSFSLNLNISTVLSPEFQTFDSGLKAGARGSIVIEIEKVDIFADIGAYLFARDFAKERGYRLCLDGMTRLTLPFVERGKLGLDLVKLFWSPDMANSADGDRQREFLTAIERTGKTRVILARCDSPQAVAFGHAAGIRLFQGRFIEKMVNSAASPTLTRNRLAPPQQAAR
jgi:EAL domain-containing protein (putative c-di-GMP-specific phosphodiesterase class I)